ncbi:MAG: twin-arginine translocase TatA/TatE family subunit [Rhizomicrobium sp.]
MLDFSWSHILVLLIVALVVVGPKDLPRLMRIVGQWMGKARAMGRPVPQELRRHGAPVRARRAAQGDREPAPTKSRSPTSTAR